MCQATSEMTSSTSRQAILSCQSLDGLIDLCAVATIAIEDKLEEFYLVLALQHDDGDVLENFVSFSV